jgi:hypothetical protein
VIGGVGLAEYLRPELFDDPSVASEAAAMRDAARGGLAMLAGMILWATGRLRSGIVERRYMRSAPPLPARRDDVNGSAGRTLEAAAPQATNGRPMGGLAAAIWRCRLGVDLQHQRLRQEGLGAETQIDAELYALALRTLLRACRHAQSMTRSLRISDAIDRFLAVAGKHDLAGTLERIDDYGQAARPRRASKNKIDDPDLSAIRTIKATYTEQGTVLHLGDLSAALTTLTTEADTLANTVVGELTEVRAIGKRASKSKVPPPKVETPKVETPKVETSNVETKA